VNRAVDSIRLSRRALAALAAGFAASGRTGARAQADDVPALISAMSARERVARMFMLPITGTALGIEDEAWLRAIKPAGVILVGDNFGEPDEVRALVAAIHATNPALPPLVALDQEGGIVSRIGDDPTPGAPELGQLPAEEITALARARAETLAGYGFDVNFAPVADIAFTPDSFMSGRAFGADPAEVAGAVAAYLEGVAGTTVLHCVKHFPGHGRVALDSHEALPTLDVDPAVWWEEDALPFRVAVDQGVPMVMLGHLVMPGWDGLPASLSPSAVRLLREDLGFGGVVVSDDLGMGALSSWEPLAILDLAVAAGNDLLLYVVLPDAPEVLVDHLTARVERDPASAERVARSVERLLDMQLGAGR
jgi:beta-N-acetylhexosaminidase